MSQVRGTVNVKVDGVLTRSKPGATLDLGGTERATVIAGKRVHFAEKVAPSMCSFTLAHAAGDDLIGLQNKIDSTLEFETDIGQTYVITGAWATKPFVLSGEEGDVACEFAGPPAELS